MDYAEQYGKVPDRVAYPAGWIRNYLRAPILNLNPISAKEDETWGYSKIDSAAWRVYQTIRLSDVYIKKYGPGWFLDNSLDLIFRRAEDMTRNEEVPIVYFNFGAMDMEIYNKDPNAFYQGMVFKITDALSDTKYCEPSQAARDLIKVGVGEDLWDFLSMGTNITQIIDLATGEEPFIHSDYDNCFRERNRAFMIANFSSVMSRPYFETHHEEFDNTGHKPNFEKIPEEEMTLVGDMINTALSLMQNCRIPGIVAVPGWAHDLYESKQENRRRLPRFHDGDMTEDRAYHRIVVEIDREF